VIAIVGIGIGVLGVIATIYFALKAQASNHARRRLEWADLQSAATDLGRRIRREFNPVALITPGLTGATFANLLADEFHGQPPVYVGVRVWKGDPVDSPSILADDSFILETQKWTVTIPKAPVRIPKGIVLIVDDFVMSGDFLNNLKEVFESAGLDSSRVRSAAIAATKVAIANHKAPDYFWWTADDDNFYFPWGKAR